MDEQELRYADGPTASVTAVVAAPPADVWALVTDINLSARFSSELQGAEWLDGATELALGARFAGHNRHPAAGEWESTSTVVELEPERSFAWAVSDPNNPAALWRFTLEPADGGTRVTQSVRIGPGRSGLSPAIEAMPDKESRIIHRRLAEHQRNMQANLDGIAALVARPSRAPRLGPLTPAVLTDEQRSLYDTIAGGRRTSGPQSVQLVADDGHLVGPFNAMLLQPALGRALQTLGLAVRFETALSAREREIAILVVATVHDSSFERYAHERIGRRAGLTDAELDALRGLLFDDFEGRDRDVATGAHALAVRHDLDDHEYVHARDALGEATIFELTTLVGYYALLALQLRVFRVTTPGD